MQRDTIYGMMDVQVLVEGPAKGNSEQWTGKTCTMKRVFFSPIALLPGQASQLSPGDYVAVEVHAASPSALLGTPLSVTTIQQFVAQHGSTVPCKPASMASPHGGALDEIAAVAG